ncbi:hypothetical protein AURDEDRAFT_178690, partial [Auricularia subglabra TFB-10046 SS5]
MSKANRQNRAGPPGADKNVPQHPAIPSNPGDGSADAPLVQSAANAAGAMQTAVEVSDDGATPRPAEVALETTTRAPHPTASPTTSEFDQAGFIPVPMQQNRKHKHPGTPSDRKVVEERHDVHAALRRESGSPTARLGGDGSRGKVHNELTGNIAALEPMMTGIADVQM